MFVVHSLTGPVSVMCTTLPVALQTVSRFLARGWEVRMDVVQPTPDDILEVSRAGSILQHPSGAPRTPIPPA